MLRPAARHDDRALEGLERQHFFEHARRLLQAGPGGGEFACVLHADLALAVVADARGFQDAGQQACGHCLELRLRFDDRVGRGLTPASARFAALAVKCDFSSMRFCAMATASPPGARAAARPAPAALRGHVLEFGGDRRRTRGQLRSPCSSP
jgi:hypothetical protein